MQAPASLRYESTIHYLIHEGYIVIASDRVPATEDDVHNFRDDTVILRLRFKWPGIYQVHRRERELYSGPSLQTAVSLYNENLPQDQPSTQTQAA